MEMRNGQLEIIPQPITVDVDRESKEEDKKDKKKEKKRKEKEDKKAKEKADIAAQDKADFEKGLSDEYYDFKSEHCLMPLIPAANSYNRNFVLTMGHTGVKFIIDAIGVLITNKIRD